ncbi:MAG: glycosyltransferase family 2 protein [Acidobacteria bacterium]|nr:glycosyltransferase family 2 protein [Acidobacteriota bacterium]
MAEARRLIWNEASDLGSEPTQAAHLRVTPRAIDVSILIVTWNSERWIDRCLRSLAAACEGLSYEVLIYDNASADRTLDHITVDDVQVLRSAENAGFAAGTNRAFRQSRGEYVFLLNPDCELAPGALTKLAAFLESHPEIAAAAPLLENESGDSQREFQLRRLPTLGTLASEILLLDKLFPANGATAHYRARDLDLTKPGPIEQPAAAALLIRRSVFEEVGPLDEQFSPAWFEDVDYCRRLAEAGKAVYYVPSAAAKHFGGASLEHMPWGQFIDVWYRNMWRYARKWLSRGEAEGLRWVIVGGMALRCLAALAGFAHPEVGRRNAVKAYWHVLKRAWKRWSPDSSPSSS